MSDMINVRTGNLLEEVTEGLILQQVNAQGKMNSGFAKAVREKYPRVWDVYSSIVEDGQPDRGLSFMGRTIPVMIKPNLYIVNIVGQQFYGKDGKKYTSYDALDTGMAEIAELNQTQQMPIHFPMMGAGLGGGNWNVIASIIEHRFAGFECNLWLLPEST